MQTILGANGQIAVELARELHDNYRSDLRLVSRNPRKVNASDALLPANLLDAGQTREAVRGSDLVYFTAGSPPDSKLWETQFPLMLKNALDACRAEGAKFAYFDNTYMYPQDDRILTEETPFAPMGRKGRVRAAMAAMVLQEMARGEIPVLIGRAPSSTGRAIRKASPTRCCSTRSSRAAGRAYAARRHQKNPDLDAGREPGTGGAGQHGGRVWPDLALALLRRPADLRATRHHGVRGVRQRGCLRADRQMDVDRRRPVFRRPERSGNCCPAMQATICSIPANSNAASPISR